MTPDEFNFFLRYVGKMYLGELKTFWKGVTNLARPKLWFFIFSVILIYQIYKNPDTFELIFILIMIMFIWMWDIYEQGHWKSDMRKKMYEKIKKQK